jgi:hypothetical protein
VGDAGGWVYQEVSRRAGWDEAVIALPINEGMRGNSDQVPFY